MVSVDDDLRREARVGRVMSDDLDARLKALESKISNVLVRWDAQAQRGLEFRAWKPRRPEVVVSTDMSASRVLLRQMSHALNTPLSQIKANALTLADIADEELSEAVRQICTSVDLSNAYLSAFRQLASLDADADIFDAESLHAAVDRVCHVYAARHHREQTRIDVDLPPQIRTCNNTLVLAILAPLIENAFEAVDMDGRVSVRHEIQPSNTAVLVGNTYSGAPLSDGLEGGVSSKKQHEGLGLPTVRRLIAARPQSELTIEQHDGEVLVRVTFAVLPGE